MVKFSSEDTHSNSGGEENEYDEEDFEQEEDDESHHHASHLRINTDAKSPKKATSKSPKRRIGTPGNDLRKSAGSHTSINPSATNSSTNSIVKDGKGLGGDLEKYLQEMESDHDGAGDDAEGEGTSKQDELQKALRPLDGMQPDGVDEEQKILYRKFGHSHGSDDTPSKGEFTRCMELTTVCIEHGVLCTEMIWCIVLYHIRFICMIYDVCWSKEYGVWYAMVCE
ncbi:hypothetical protein EON65_55890 [archaeon]|nr:MAG: hypothetical protein EON65_55890 [archaeon]